MRIFVDKAEKLAGDSIFDKLDPYCIVKLGEFKRFQTPVLWNVGPNPTFEHNGVLTFSNEEEITFTVMDYDKFSADDMCGHATVPVADLYEGFKGKIELYRPKRALGGLGGDDEEMMEFAGKLSISVKYDYEKVTSLSREPKQRTWKDESIFTLKVNESWGQEQAMLGPTFRRILDGSTSQMPFNLTLGSFRLFGAQQKATSEKIVLLKSNKKRFIQFIQKSQRQKQFLQACRGHALDKQQLLKAHVRRLIDRWEAEQQTEVMRSGQSMKTDETVVIDPSKFRVAYRGTKANISIRSALNLSGGGWFDKLDPYAIVRFRGSKQEVRTAVLQDAGSDPCWDNEGTLTYHGEVALEIAVWDYDTYSSDDLIATGVIQVEQFCNGFEGMIPLSLPGDKKKSVKQALITLGIVWDQPQDPAMPKRPNTSDQSLTM